MSLDIKTFRPRKQIPIHIHQCQACSETVLHSQPVQSHGDVSEKCSGKLTDCGNFFLTIEYTPPKELQSFIYNDENTGEKMIRYGELAAQKIVGWEGLKSGEKELKFDKAMVSDVLEPIPGLLDLVWILSASRNLFGLPNIEAFSKNLNGQSNGKTSTKTEVSQPTAQRA